MTPDTPKSIAEVFDQGAKIPTASELIEWASQQGWSQKPGSGPRTFVDPTGRIRLKIKDGVPRSGIQPASQVPHVEVFDENGQRIDPHTGLPTGKRTIGNHRPIDFDVPPF